MQPSKPTFGVKLLLFLLFFLGILITAWIILDAEVFRTFITPPKKSETVENINHTAPKSNDTPKSSSKVDQLRQSIVLVVSQDCDTRELGYGTGFVVKAERNERYVATNAHVVRDGLKCNGIMIIDYKGRKHRTEMVGISMTNDFRNDMTVLKLENITDNDLPPLVCLNSSEYQSGHDGEKIVTIGYPVLGTASTPDKASISSEGQISQYDTTNNHFIASGLSLNPGNSGGPVFLVENYKVLGIAVAKADILVAENVGMFIPINRFKNFFREKTGKEL
jgi:S1-C subfamily serine protease